MIVRKDEQGSSLIDFCSLSISHHKVLTPYTQAVAGRDLLQMPREDVTPHAASASGLFFLHRASSSAGPFPCTFGAEARLLQLEVKDRGIMSMSNHTRDTGVRGNEAGRTSWRRLERRWKTAIALQKGAAVSRRNETRSTKIRLVRLCVVVAWCLRAFTKSWPFRKDNG